MNSVKTTQNTQLTVVCASSSKMLQTLANIMKARLVRAFFIVFLCVSAVACTSVENRIATKDDIAHRHHLTSQIMNGQGEGLVLYTLANDKPMDGQTMTVFIEGDGLAWQNRRTKSLNPTPVNPVGLKLMTKHQAKAIYMARPCQYVVDAGCEDSLWTNQRFSLKVIDSYHAALDQLKNQSNINGFNVVGYSGGAYIALVLAATRNDINNVTTYAGLLGPHAWTAHHRVAPLQLTYNLSTLLDNSRDVKFVHYCGTNDDIIPCSLNDAVAAGLYNHRLIRLDKTHETIAD